MSIFLTTVKRGETYVTTFHLSTRARRSYLNEREELALGGMVPRRPWRAAFFGRGA